MINARAETLAEKPGYRSLIRQAKHRCLILTDGFYEWQKPEDPRQPRRPLHFSLGSGEPFCFAGLWTSWTSPEGDVVPSCTIVTCDANELTRPIHDRMPVILADPEVWECWLDPGGRIGGCARGARAARRRADGRATRQPDRQFGQARGAGLPRRAGGVAGAPDVQPLAGPPAQAGRPYPLRARRPPGGIALARAAPSVRHLPMPPPLRLAGARSCHGRLSVAPPAPPPHEGRSGGRALARPSRARRPVRRGPPSAGWPGWRAARAGTVELPRERLVHLHCPPEEPARRASRGTRHPVRCDVWPLYPARHPSAADRTGDMRRLT
jgi:SOS response associated peptidase (SRAP)